jgi:hypothetical protein
MEYRWDELLDGGAHLYRAGRDFDLPPDRFAGLIAATAQEFGLTAVTKVDGQFVAFRAGPAVRSPAPALSYGIDQDIELIAQLRNEGASFAEIGRRLGVPWQSAHRAYAKHVKQAVDAAH